MPDKPHIVVLNPDQWRGDVLGHMGNSAAVTPNLDQAVREDTVSFRNAFCQNPVCTPSRCSFMTGWYPHTRGHRTMYHMLKPDEPMLLKSLKDQGWFVWWGGKNDVVPAQHGYADYCNVKYKPPNTPERPLRPNTHAADSWRGAPGSDNYYSFFVGQQDKDPAEHHIYDSDWAFVEGAIELIRNPPTDKPLCIYLPLTYPHPPYAVEDPWFSAIERDKLPPRIPTPAAPADEPSLLTGIRQRQNMGGWDEARWTELRATYYGMCARVDAQFGMIRAALQEAGMYDETAFFLFSDHGDFTGDYGLVEKTQNTFEDCLTNVPFLIKPPASFHVQPGVRDALVELIDFPATVEAISGIDMQHTHFGRSLLPLLAGEESSHRDAVFCEGGRIHGERQAMELDSDTSTKSLYWPRNSIQRSEGPEHSKAVMCRTQTHKYVYRLYERDELYDLCADPGEVNNRIDDPALAVVLQELQQRTLRFMVETTDNVPWSTDKRR